MVLNVADGTDSSCNDTDSCIEGASYRVGGDSCGGRVVCGLRKSRTK